MGHYKETKPMINMYTRKIGNPEIFNKNYKRKFLKSKEKDTY